MVNHPNRNWRKRWSCDAINLTAKHESGLIVEFKAAKDCEGALDGAIKGDIPDSLNWRSDPKLLSDLMRQAGDCMYTALENQEKH